MSTSLATLRARVREEFGDDTTFFDATSIDEAIHEGLLDVADRLDLVGRALLLTTDDTAFYTFQPVDALGPPFRAYFVDDSTPMEIKSLQQMDADYGTNWKTQTSAIPQVLIPLGVDLIAIWPTPSEDDLEIIIEYPRHALLPISTIELMELEDHLLDEVARYATVWLSFMESSERFIDRLKMHTQYREDRAQTEGLLDRDNRWLL